MSANNDGGPAFPAEAIGIPGQHITSPATQGMSLRDYFAGQALAGMASIALDDGDMIMGWAEMARASYNAADAMLAVRSKGGAS